jgi:hypothetical protein
MLVAIGVECRSFICWLVFSRMRYSIDGEIDRLDVFDSH